MFSKLTFVALIAAAFAAPQHHTAGQFPAGVDPLKCPNFPICDNAALHGQQASPVKTASSWDQQSQSQWNQAQPQQQWNQPQPQAQQQWNQPQQQYQPQPQQQAQPQYNQWNLQSQPQHQQQYKPQPQQSWNSAPYQAPSNHLSNSQQKESEEDITGPGGDKYPAGVNPKSCPNYPYCDSIINNESPVTSSPQPRSYNQGQYPAGVSPHSCPNFPYCN